jgi:alpha-amylase
MIRTVFCLSICAAFAFASCKTGATSDVNDQAIIDGHPAWMLQGNIYEVNIRQYTPEGTFRAFGQHLDRLKEMGVQTLWFMPINPISVKDRKGAMGSYYAIADYKAVNPEFGTLGDWKSLVNNAHDKGFKVIIDWVPNHTGADHPWLTTHTDFYEKDSMGKPISPFDWSDVRKLDYKNAVLADSMIAAMKYWITETGIDGFRVDVAWSVPKDFFLKAIPELRKTKNIFMLAEAEEPWVHEAGFDASYGWNAFHMMNRIAKGERKASALDSAVVIAEKKYPASALRMYFTSNHDENSWNKADYGTMPGDVHAPFALLSQTLPKSVPLIYSGQEEPVLDSISFFYKNPIRFGSYKRAAFYKTLLALRKNNPALAANASFTKVPTSLDDQVYAFVRQKGNDRVLVVANLSSKTSAVSVTSDMIKGKARNVFTGQAIELNSTTDLGLSPWGYVVFEYK